MTENPLINALSATLYISVVASVMFFTEKSSEPVYPLLVGIAMLSLFVLSVAVMGYILDLPHNNRFTQFPQFLAATCRKILKIVELFLRFFGYVSLKN